MKKIFLLLATTCLLIIACKNPLKPGSEAIASAFSASDSIPRSTALTMIAHYMDTPQVNHGPDFVFRQATLHNSDLFKIFQISNITRIRILDAAYLNTDPVVGRRNKITALVQVKKGYHSDYYYYDIQSFGADRICPPPNGCSTE